MLKPDINFVWEPFLKALQLEFKLYDLEFDVLDRSRADKVVKTAFLKDSSFGKLFVFRHPRGPSDKRVIKIKLEIDTNPPEGSAFEANFISFPYSFSIVTQDLPSLFASKCHALLCRPYTKGRDWFDFVWYVSKNINPNYILLKYAIEQAGPWSGKKNNITKEWLSGALIDKISKINWDDAKRDVENFLRERERESLKVWGKDFFIAMVKKLV